MPYFLPTAASTAVRVCSGTSDVYSVELRTATSQTTRRDGWYEYPSSCAVTGWRHYEITSASSCPCIVSWHNYVAIPEQNREQQISVAIREIMRSRTAPRARSRYTLLSAPIDVREERARETLRRVVGEEKYLTFLKKGFVSVRAKSGRVYQLFTDHKLTNVFENGRLVEKLCVYLAGGFPPTDALIMRYILLLNNEESFRSKANKHEAHDHRAGPLTRFLTEVKQKSLPQIFRELKKPN